MLYYLRTNMLVRKTVNKMVRKVFRVGHSYCITLPKKMLKEVDLEYSDWAWVDLDKNKRIIIRKRKVNEW